MELLYELNNSSYNTFVYKIQTAIPNTIFKVRIDFSKSSTDNKIYLFENNNWVLLMEDNFKITPQTGITSGTTGGFSTVSNSMNTMQNNNVQRDERVKFYMECIYKLLCI